MASCKRILCVWCVVPFSLLKEFQVQTTFNPGHLVMVNLAKHTEQICELLSVCFFFLWCLFIANAVSCERQTGWSLRNEQCKCGLMCLILIKLITSTSSQHSHQQLEATLFFCSGKCRRSAWDTWKHTASLYVHRLGSLNFFCSFSPPCTDWLSQVFPLSSATAHSRKS